MVSKIYDIEDCEYYSTTLYSSDVSLNIPVTSKNACTVELDIIKSASNNGAFLMCGTDSNNYIGVGLMGRGYYGFILQHNNTRVTTQTDTNLINGTFHAVLTYDNGSITSVINNKTKIYTYTQPIDYILGTWCRNSGQIKNIKVKPL